MIHPLLEKKMMPRDLFQVFFVIYSANSTNRPPKSLFKQKKKTNTLKFKKILPFFKYNNIFILHQMFGCLSKFHHKLSHFAQY